MDCMVTNDIDFSIPGKVNNIIAGIEKDSAQQCTFDKINPHNGEIIAKIARSEAADVNEAVVVANQSYKDWSLLSPVRRGEILFEIALLMKKYQKELAQIVSLETGKSYKDAYGETSGAISLGMFMAGEGQRLYGRTTTSSVQNKYPMIIREPVGVAALIIAFNTPIANVAWKVFPALICGNTVVLKASEDTPLTSYFFGRIAHSASLPKGVLNIIQGYGHEAGELLVNHSGIDLISFTGSTSVGKRIAKVAGEKLIKTFLELGGKNPLVVDQDANLDNAIKWILLSAFSNAGQRCASCSRVIIHEDIYESIKDSLVEKTRKLKLGTSDEDDLGPVINEKQLNNILDAVTKAQKTGAHILIGGKRLSTSPFDKGYYMQPTIIENATPESDISQQELFGPVVCLYRFRTFQEAIDLANNTSYGLTACIHTKDVDKANEFVRRVRTGVAVINGGTYGSEPNMPFGGVKNSGNGFREPGSEALEVYSNYKNIITLVDTNRIYK